MASNAESFERKCKCGAVRIGYEWRRSPLITKKMPEVKKLKKGLCPECREAGLYHDNLLLVWV